MESLNQQLKEFFDTVVPLATHIPAANYSSDPDLRVALEGFVAERPAVLYATVLNNQARGVQAQARNFKAGGDPFLRKSLEAAFTAAQQGQEYRSNPITVLGPEGNDVVMVMAEPMKQKNQFLGMVAAVVTLKPITQELVDTNGRSGLEAYVVDNSGRLVTSYDPDKVAGMDMVAIPIVQKFLDWDGSRARGGDFSLPLAEGQPRGHDARHLRAHAKAGLGRDRPTENQRRVRHRLPKCASQTFQLGLLLVVLSLVIGFLAAKAITSPHRHADADGPLHRPA